MTLSGERASSALPALQARTESLSRWMLDHALPQWWERGADRERGGWHDVIDQDGGVPAVDRRARVQARQTYVYAAAGGMGWSGPWREAAEHGLDFLMTRYRRPDGLFRTKVRPDGAPADETAVLYDQAFVLFALAALIGAGPERTDLAATGRALAEAVRGRFAHSAGGFREDSESAPFQSNAHMHLFEASLAWAEVDAAPVWPALADEIAALCLQRFIDPRTGALREFFDAQWRPAPGVAGRIVEPGHQFEWAWLLQRWGALRDRADAQAAASRLLEIGAGHGIDSARGVAINAMLNDFTAHDADARLWPQTERIKAAAALAASAQDEAVRDARLAEAVRGVDGLQRYFATPITGLWFDRMRADGEMVQEPAPASSFYHIALAIAELRRALGPHALGAAA